MSGYLRWIETDRAMRRMDINRPNPRRDIDVYHAPPTGSRDSLLNRPSYTTGGRSNNAAVRYTGAGMAGREPMGVGRADWTRANYSSQAHLETSGAYGQVGNATPFRGKSGLSSFGLERDYTYSRGDAAGSTSTSYNAGLNVGRTPESYVPAALRNHPDTRYDGHRYDAPTAYRSTPLRPSTAGVYADASPRGYEAGVSHNTSFMTQVTRSGLTALAPRPATPSRAYETRSHTPLGRYGSASVVAPLSPTTQHRLSSGLGLLRNNPLSYSRPLLILDLDETLVHASVERRPTGHDFQFLVDMGADSVTVFVAVRPYAEEFLRRVSQLFEVCIFTASVSAYANGVIDRLDPQRRYIHHRLYREHCTYTHGNYVKDLSRMGRPMDRLCLVDNSPITYDMQPQNGVPIVSWFDDPNDRELLNLLPLLEHFARSGNFYESARVFGIKP